MRELKDIRKDITEIDNKMAELFCKRMELVKQVAECKQICGMPIYDPEREAQVLENGAQRVDDSDMRGYYVNYLKAVMDVSKEYQRNLIRKQTSDGIIIPVKLENDSYDVILKRGALSEAGTLMNLDRKVLVVTDSGVPEEHVSKITCAAREAVVITLPEGEGSKTLDNFEMLCRKMLDEGFNRKDCVVAVGGGVCGDLAGFAAACYMRGIDFYNVPTTLLAQVDSSVGGKTAVDLGDVKNIVGAFHQPKAVIIDPDVLETLSPQQFACGAAEIIKMAMTFDKEWFEELRRDGVAADVDKHIAAAVRNKVRVVEEDEKEAGLRKALNFGHTLGHGIESVTGMLHGECVALGMLPMCAPELRPVLAEMLQREGLPATCNTDSAAVAAAAMHDKKAEDGGILTVRVDAAGTFRFEKASEEDMRKLYEECFW